MNVMCECERESKGRASTTTLLQWLQHVSVWIHFHLFYAQYVSRCLPRISITHLLIYSLNIWKHRHIYSCPSAVPLPGQRSKQHLANTPTIKQPLHFLYSVFAAALLEHITNLPQECTQS